MYWEFILFASYIAASPVEQYPVSWKYPAISLEPHSPARPISTKLLHLDILDFHFPADTPTTLDAGLLATPKWFQEDSFSAHRTNGHHRLTQSETISALRHTFHAFTRFANSHELVFWLAHGSLLGQFFGGKIMPFDDDIDLQTSLATLFSLSKYHNRLIDNRYKIDVNPWFQSRTSENSHVARLRRLSGRYRHTTEPNIIDARVIDTQSGVFIDITALSAEISDEIYSDIDHGRMEANDDERVHDKSVHTYPFRSISPLRSCIFEDTETWCSNVDLGVEYPSFKNQHGTWRYNARNRRFEEIDCEALFDIFSTGKDCDEECAGVVRHERRLQWGWTERDDQCLLLVSYTKDGVPHEKQFLGINPMKEHKLI